MTQMTFPGGSRVLRPAAVTFARALAAALPVGAFFVWSFIVAMPAAAQETVFDLGALPVDEGFAISNDTGDFLSRMDIGGAVGDINGDGFEDFAWGGTDDDAGRPIYVVFGRGGAFPALLAVSTLDGSNGFVVSDDGARLAEATSVERAGDVNGDGFDDFAVGAHRLGGGAVDSVGFVVYGRATFPASVDYLDLDTGFGFFIGDSATWPSGPSRQVFIREAGDVNGDGRDDLFVGLPDADSEPADPSLNPGAAYLIYGRSSDFPGVLDLDDLDGSNGFTMPPVPESDDANRQDFARSGGYVGDLNGDGRDDFAVGRPFARGQESDGGIGIGAVDVVYGRDTNFPASLDLASLAPSEGFSVIAASPPDDVGDLGWSLTDLGDFDGDGVGDLLIGSPLSNPPGLADTGSGSAFIVYGAADGADVIAGTGGGARVTALIPVEFPTLGAGDSLPNAAAVGIDVAGGDVNGDGLDDAVLGNGGSTSADGRAAAGVSYVVFGRTGRPATLDLFSLAAFGGYRIIGSAGDFAGRSIDAADVAGADGRSEVLIAGEGFHDVPDGSLVGAVQVVLGGAEPGLFADGFESGDTLAWFATVGGV
ncbi:MAG: hypothetical protein AAGM22_10275 [Acidobacteriota bacterium]